MPSEEFEQVRELVGQYVTGPLRIPAPLFDAVYEQLRGRGQLFERAGMDEPNFMFRLTTVCSSQLGKTRD